MSSYLFYIALSPLTAFLFYGNNLKILSSQSADIIKFLAAVLKRATWVDSQKSEEQFVDKGIRHSWDASFEDKFEKLLFEFKWGIFIQDARYQRRTDQKPQLDFFTDRRRTEICI